MANSNGWGDGAANNAIGWGQGANNNIGWGDSHAKSWAGATDIVGLTTDADAQAFITAAAITDATQQDAIDALVVGLKADGIWTKMKAIYPFVGGTASTHKYNLKDPRDLDAAFRLVFNGGWTHSSNGALPNGTNGYADTKLVPSSVLTLNSGHLSFYSRTNTSTGVDDIASTITGDTQNMRLIIKFGASLFSDINSLTQRVTVANANSLGFYQTSRINATSLKVYKNASVFGTNTNTNTGTQPATSLYISASHFNAGVTNYSDRQVAFSSIGDGLTDTDASNLYTRVQTYQTALSRNV
jgi:hypothetical protein